MKQKVRISEYGDYIALDFVGKDGVIETTPFYIANGREVEVHWPTPIDERPANPFVYDDWYDKYVFRMDKGELFCKWINGPCWNGCFTKIQPHELIDWKFQCAKKIINQRTTGID